MNTTPNSDQIRDMAHQVTAILFSATDKALAGTWVETETTSSVHGSTPTALVRGWVMDEIESRIGADLFDEWLSANTPDPAPYLARARNV